MMTKCLEIPAGEPGEEFLRECLGNGKNMGGLLLDLVTSALGDVTAVVPLQAEPREGFGLASAEMIRRGGFKHHGGGTLVYLAARATEYLASGTDHLFIVEDAMCSRNAPGLAKSVLPVLFHGDDVYWFVSPDDRRDAGKMDTAVGQLEYWGSIGVMTSWPAESAVVDRMDITLSHLRALAAGVQRIVVSAYDGEGFLIWYRGGWEGR